MRDIPTPPRRSTDRTRLCGSRNVGSIPAEGTYRENARKGVFYFLIPRFSFLNIKTPTDP